MFILIYLIQFYLTRKDLHMKNFTKKAFVISALMMIITIVPTFASDISVTIDGTPVVFDVPPTIVENRTLVPVRAIFEALGIEISWDDRTKTVSAFKGDTTITLPVGKNIAYKNGMQIQMDVPPIIIDGRTLVPVRFISENLGLLVNWDGSSRTVSITSAIKPGTTEVIDSTDNTNVIDDLENNETLDTVSGNDVTENIEDGSTCNLLNIKIGDSESKVLEAFGTPNRKDLSKYGFTWYVYNSDYSRYLQFGISDGKVVGLYSNSDIWSFNNISYGTLKSAVKEILGLPLDAIRKGNTLYSKIDDNQEENVYLIDNSYITFYYDIYENHKILSFEAIEKSVEESFLGFYGAGSEDLRHTFEMQIFDITNSTRYNRGLPLLSYDKKISVTARNHSKDMVIRDYFSHENPDGESPFDRMKSDGIDYSYAAENLSYGATNAHQAVNSWMNSLGHRRTLLSDVKRLGVGTAFYEDGRTTHTQNFYTPRD
jgi:uncharacterized protein YkwD